MNYLKVLSITYYMGMALVFIGVVMGVAKVENAAWVMAAGVLPVLVVRIFNRAVCTKERERRNSILISSALFLGVAAYILYTGRNYWPIAVLISAALDTYISFRKI